MSEMATMLNSGLLGYLASHARPETEFFKELKEAAREAGFPPIWIAPEQGWFMQILLRLAKARTVVEVGTQTGYSAITMAQALPDDGHIDSIDNNTEAVGFASEWIERSPAAGRVTLHSGDARDILPTLAAGAYDAAFVDADKDGYPIYLKECLRLVRSGGLLMIDNAFAYGQVIDEAPQRKTDDVWAIRAFNQLMARDPDVEGIIVPIGDGMWVAVRH